mgnify:FL=1
MAEIIYPYKRYNYKVLLDGREEAGFSEVSGPGIVSDPVEYRMDRIPGKQARQLKYSNVTLWRGTTESRACMEWMNEIQDGKATRKTVVVTLLDDEMNEVASWQLEKCWPTRYTAPDFNATSSETAIESLELVTEGIRRIK